MVPFGYERNEMEKQIESMMPEPRLYQRVYLYVIADMKPSGNLIPVYFKWGDNKIKIDQVLDSQNGSSFKVRTKAIRFYCRCGRQKFYLFFEDGGFGNQRFYIELKEGVDIHCAT